MNGEKNCRIKKPVTIIEIRQLFLYAFFAVEGYKPIVMNIDWYEDIDEIKEK